MLTYKNINGDYVRKSLEVFLEEYGHYDKEDYWNKKSGDFYNFWNNKIRNKDYVLKQSDIDYLIRIIDSNARGHIKGEDVIAKTIIYQNLWEKALHDLKNNQDLQEAFDKIVNTHTVEQLIPLIDNLFLVNRHGKNGLNGHGANMINAFLFLKNPNIFLSIISLKHRNLIMKKFDLRHSGVYKTRGEEIVKTNFDILYGFNKKYNVNLTPRALSEFLYTPHGIYSVNIKKIWYERNPNKQRKTLDEGDDYEIDGCKIKFSALRLERIVNKKIDSETIFEHHYSCERDRQDEQSRKGAKGEEIVLLIERQRLTNGKRLDLAEKVDNVSNDYSLGYDILSYDVDGKKRHIEVKSTSLDFNCGVFYITKNELEKSQKIDNYYLYFVYNVDESPEVKFLKSPNLADVNLFELVPQKYLVRYNCENG